MSLSLLNKFQHGRTVAGRRRKAPAIEMLWRKLPIEKLETRSLLSAISLVDDHSVGSGQDLHSTTDHVLPTLIEQVLSADSANNEPGTGGHSGGCCCPDCVPTGMTNPQPPY